MNLSSKSSQQLSVFCVLAIFFFSCKQTAKKPDNDEGFFPVLSFLQSQVAMVDTSLYGIQKLTPRDSLGYDTVFIHRDQFRGTAQDFLTVPDLASKEYADRYRETKQFDESLNRVILTYEPKEPAKELIQFQQVLIQPDGGGDKVTNIIINMVSSSRDSSVQKRLLWKTDQSFQVSTTKQYPGQPETNNTYKVTWNEHDYE